MNPSVSVFQIPESENRQNALEKARDLLQHNQASCVLMASDGNVICREDGRGIGPILEIYDRLNGNMKNAMVADKVIGKAAAFVAVCGAASFVYAEVMSQGAYELLEQHQIPAAFALLVPQIINRRKDGPCPMESAVAGVTDPFEALHVIRQKRLELTKISSPLS